MLSGKASFGPIRLPLFVVPIASDQATIEAALSIVRDQAAPEVAMLAHRLAVLLLVQLRRSCGKPPCPVAESLVRDCGYTPHT